MSKRAWALYGLGFRIPLEHSYTGHKDRAICDITRDMYICIIFICIYI